MDIWKAKLDLMRLKKLLCLQRNKHKFEVLLVKLVIKVPYKIDYKVQLNI
jgi:hypothetical protein